MKKIFLNISLFAFGIGLFASCDSLLDVKPRTAIDASTALTNETALFAALRGSYDRLQSTDLYGSSQIALAEALGDNGRGRLASGASTNSGRLAGQLQHINGAHLAGWTQYYLLINQVNLILEATPNVKELSSNSRRIIEGQALFLRALAYHDLLKSYAYDPGVEVPANDRGGVPLVLTGVLDVAQVTFPSRAPVQAVYDQIYKDLEEAYTRLNGATGIQAPAFAGAGAVLALHSRVALFRRDYATAVQKANDAILFIPPIRGATDYKSGWRSPVHPESIFELPFTTPENIGVNVSLQSYYTSTIISQPNTVTGGFGDLVINNIYGTTLSSQITTLPTIASGTITRDERFASTGAADDIVRLGSLGRGNQALQELCKFYGKNGQPNLDNIPLIRTPEVILNRAEAQFYLGNETAARADLLTIINNRYTNNGAISPTPIGISLSGTALINEILRQRRLEFAFEGHRFFDMKRNGENFPRPGGLPTTQYVDTRILAPIPQADLNANPNLVQNAGY